MCGIVGVLAYGKSEKEKVRQESMIFFASELLRLTQKRGEDATGVATLFNDGDFMGLKMGIPASEFTARFGGEKDDYEGFVNVWRKKKSPAKMFIGHCRKPSAMSAAGPEDNKNNHPIRVGDIVGVHNGTLSNDKEIFDKMSCERDGKVDSEAIFRLLEDFTNSATEPFTLKTLREVCIRLEGTYSVLAFNGNNPNQLAAFREGRPLEVALIKPLGIVLVASEISFLKTVIYRYNQMAHLYTMFKMVKLRGSDVEIATATMLPDSTAYVFNLYKDVTAETKLSDLYDMLKVPTTEKLSDWKSPAKSYNSSYNSYTQNYSNGTGGYTANPSSAGTSKNSAEQGKSSSKRGRIGMMWSKSKHSYIAVPSEDEEHHTHTEINCGTGEVLDALTNVVLVKGDKNEPSHENTVLVEDTITLTDTTKSVCCEDVPEGEIRDMCAVFSNADAPSNMLMLPPPTDNQVSSEVDMTVYPEAEGLSRKAAAEAGGFEDAEDVALTIGLVGADELYELTRLEIANLVKSAIYKEAFAAGYIAKTKGESSQIGENSSRAMLERAKAKAIRSRATIRNVKEAAKLFSDMAEILSEDTLNRKVSEAKKSGSDLDPNVLSSIFRPGDTRKYPMIGALIKAAAAAEKG